MISVTIQFHFLVFDRTPAITITIQKPGRIHMCALRNLINLPVRQEQTTHFRQQASRRRWLRDWPNTGLSEAFEVTMDTGFLRKFLETVRDNYRQLSHRVGRGSSNPSISYKACKNPKTYPLSPTTRLNSSSASEFSLLGSPAQSHENCDPVPPLAAQHIPSCRLYELARLSQ